MRGEVSVDRVTLLATSGEQSMSGRPPTDTASVTDGIQCRRGSLQKLNAALIGAECISKFSDR